MSIETQLDLDLDKAVETAVEDTIEELRQRVPPLAVIGCSPRSRVKLAAVLCRLRAEGVAALVLLRSAEPALNDSDLIALFSFLRDWDQLLLKNILELCRNWIPKNYHAQMEQEARSELKWFEQWQAASSDPRVHKYPSLPWRSFLRKINAENFIFAQDLMELTQRPMNDTTKKAMIERFQSFLDAKKKTICVFPKRWN